MCMSRRAYSVYVLDHGVVCPQFQLPFLPNSKLCLVFDLKTGHLRVFVMYKKKVW